MNDSAKELILDLLDGEINRCKYAEFNGRSESQARSFDEMNRQTIIECEEAKLDLEKVTASTKGKG